MSSLIQSEPSIKNVEGKRGHEDVSDSVDDNKIKKIHGEISDLDDLGDDVSASLDDDEIEKIKRIQGDIPGLDDPNIVSRMCRCGLIDNYHASGHDSRRIVPLLDLRTQFIPDTFVPPMLWPFVEEMTKNNDGKPVVATRVSSDINDNTAFLNLFKPFGEVISANLAPVNLKTRLYGPFGFVTFANKKDAQKAIHELNGFAHGEVHKCNLKVDWAPTRDKLINLNASINN